MIARSSAEPPSGQLRLVRAASVEVADSSASAPLSLLGLLQLADSCFPAGGFAFSNGLEGLAKSGRIRDLEDFREYLISYLGQTASADLPFLNSAWAAAGILGSDFGAIPAGSEENPACPAPGPRPVASASSEIPPFGSTPSETSAGLLAPGETFADVALEWDAFLFLPAPRRASLAMGQAWLRAMEGAHGTAAVKSLRPLFRAQDLPAHFLMAFAASLWAAGLPLGESQTLLLHMALRDQLGAAVRLGLVGSLQAQGLHQGCLALAEDLRLRQAGRGHRASAKTAPMIELGQAAHPYLYSRLFQS